MKNFLHRFALAAIAAFLVSCGHLSRLDIDPDAAAARAFALHGDLRQEVDGLAASLVPETTPGLIVGVLEANGRMSFFSYGFAELATGRKIEADTPFPVGSLSKGFTAALLQRAVARGDFRWDSQVGQIVTAPTWNDEVRKLSLNELASHLSGMPRQPWNLRIFGDFLLFLVNGENFYQSLDRDCVEKWLADFSRPAKREPIYSNLGYAVLGRVLEQSSGKSLDDLLADEICRPLGLTSSAYGRVAGDPVQGYSGDQPKFMRRGKPVPPWDFPEAMKGSAALHSSARDLLIFAREHFPGGAFADNLQVQFPRPQEAMARAWCVDSFGDDRLCYQVGFVSGFSAYLGLDAKHRNAVVVLQNSFNWQDQVGHRLLLRLARRDEILNAAHRDGPRQRGSRCEKAGLGRGEAAEGL